MATTKELLEKSMLRLGSRGARGDESTRVTVSFDQTSESDQFYTAPADGFFIAYALATTWQYASLELRTASGGVFQPTCGDGGVIYASVLATKGQNVRFRFQNLTSRTVEFVKSIGGGA